MQINKLQTSMLYHTKITLRNTAFQISVAVPLILIAPLNKHLDKVKLLLKVTMKQGSIMYGLFT